MLFNVIISIFQVLGFGMLRGKDPKLIAQKTDKLHTYYYSINNHLTKDIITITINAENSLN